MNLAALTAEETETLGEALLAPEDDVVLAAAFSADERRRLAKRGEAMEDGAFPIRNKADLGNAIQAVGRAADPAKAKAWIKRRAKALGAEDMLPDEWLTAAAPPAVLYGEDDTDAENRARQAEELCPYCNGTGQRTHEAMAASAGLNDWEEPYAINGMANGTNITFAGTGVSGPNAHVHVGEPFGTGRALFDFDPYGTQVLTAAAAGLVPEVPPLAWFEMPEPNEPTPLTITADGQIYGHGWLWNTCHTGQPGRCTTAPRSQSGYKFFHLGGVDTQEGVTVATGKITFGAGHAPLTASRAGTAAHYDNTAHAGADVVVRDGKWGGWVTGALRPDLPAKVVRTLRAAALSGDWRSVNGALELIGLLAVNVPGFPVPRAQAALAASGELDEMEALVAAGMLLPTLDVNDEECEPCLDEALDELIAPVELDALFR